MSIGQVREKFLARTPNAKSMEIRRILPDTMAVDIVERVPLARLVSRSGTSLAADREGVLFAVGPAYRDLPTIIGYDEAGFRPGTRARGTANSAILLLEACDNPRLGLRVVSVDIQNSDYLLLKLADGTPVKFGWEKMGEDTAESRKNLLKKLVRLAQSRQAARGKPHKGFDATYTSDMIVGQ
jgi:cell division septal protein FtsQ